MKLCRLNFFSFELYKEIINLAKERQSFSRTPGNQDVLYTIVEKIEEFLSSKEFDIAKYEEISLQNNEFIETLAQNKDKLVSVRDCLGVTWPLQRVQTAVNSPTNAVLLQSKSHSRIMSNFEDERAKLNNDLFECKESMLSKNTCMSNGTEKQYEK